MTAKILIVGAGATGLMAARELVNGGYKVTLIEARDRIGGRIHPLPNKFSISVEAGAEFVHGKQPLTLALIEKSKSQAIPFTGNRYQVWRGALQHGDFFDDKWDLLTKALRELKSDTDMANFLNENFSEEKYSELRQKVWSFVEGYDAADMNRASAKALGEEWSGSDNEHQYRIQGGYIRLMQFLEQDIIAGGGEFLFSAAVREIGWSKGNVKLSTASGNVLEGEKVVITVPLGVLQKDLIQFSPALPDHRRAFNHIGFGGVIKFFFEFDRAFWEDRVRKPFNDVAFIFSDAEIPTWWSHRPDTTPLLTGWLGGPATTNIRHDSEVLYQKALESLGYIFRRSPSEINSGVRNWHTADWVSDPYCLGAYAYPTVQTPEARIFISTPVENTLFFAGEALYDGAAMGTVEAGLANGKTVANKIMA